MFIVAEDAVIFIVAEDAVMFIVAEDAVMFVETSAKFSQKSVLIAFEVSIII